MPKVLKLGLASALVAGCAFAGSLVPRVSGPAQERKIAMKARQYAFEPPVLHVNLGDTVRLRITAEDVVHGFYLEGYDIDARLVPQNPFMELSRPSRPDAPPEKVEEIVFVAEKTGKFRYRCSHTCGTMHPFMCGEMVVAPNRLFGAGIGGAVGMLLAGCVMVMANGNKRAPTIVDGVNNSSCMVKEGTDVES